MEDYKAIRPAFFGAKFSELYKAYKKDHRCTQTDFGKLFDPEITRQTITSWKSGEVVPEKYNLDQICSIFGVTIDEFIPRTDSDIYAYEADRQTDIAENTLLPFCETIGLDIDFIRLARKLLGSQFDESFPVWTPIQKVSFFDNEYTRLSPSDLPKAAENGNNDYLQVTVNENGAPKLITLTYTDLLFLKDLQDRITDTITFEFSRRFRELAKEIDEINKAAADSIVIEPDGKISYHILDLFEFDDYSRRVRNILRRK